MLLQRLCLGVTRKCETSSAIAVAVVRNPFSEMEGTLDELDFCSNMVLSNTSNFSHPCNQPNYTGLPLQ